MDYDFIIVGAGIAGLYSALTITKAFPKARVALMEMYDSLGGRIQTYHKGAVQFEKGAGRIHSSHTLVNSLVAHYGLTKIKIPSEEAAEWHPMKAQVTKNMWASLAAYIVSILHKLDKSVLQTHTLEEILYSTMDGQKVKAMLNRFAYTSEIVTLRADIALESLSNELGGREGYFYVLKEGLASMVDHMAKDLKGKVDIFTEHRLVSLTTKDKVYLNFTPTNNKTKVQKTFKATKAILAIHADALKGIAIFKNLPILKHLSMTPLLRIYGVFPKPAWFADIPRTITDSPLRNVIPISAASGTIMTSYTDNTDTKFWLDILKKEGEKGVSDRIITESEKLFDRSIPKPTFFKMCHWKHGCSYWLPGLYDVREESRRIMQPIPLAHPNVFVCGESYAVNQAWVESALSHADDMLQRFILV
jgi:monoamine oxidase